jgi:hypothetical protein
VRVVHGRLRWCYCKTLEAGFIFHPGLLISKFRCFPDSNGWLCNRCNVLLLWLLFAVLMLLHPIRSPGALALIHQL